MTNGVVDYFRLIFRDFGGLMMCRRRRFELTLLAGQPVGQSPTAERESTAARLEVEKDNGAGDEDNRWPEHAVHDVGATVRLVRYDAARVGRVVEAVERDGGVASDRVSDLEPPLVGELVDGALVIITCLETDAERALRQQYTHTHSINQ